LPQTGAGRANNWLEVNSAVRFQQMVGFGATMTESSAFIINNHPRRQEVNTRTPNVKFKLRVKFCLLFAQILDFLFKPHAEGGIDMSVVRLPVSMLSDFIISEPYTYVQEGDLNLDSFSIERDRGFFIPIIKAALAIKPDIKFIAVPWSAPGW
jgi:glucosylceramidase